MSNATAAGVFVAISLVVIVAPVLIPRRGPVSGSLSPKGARKTKICGRCSAGKRRKIGDRDQCGIATMRMLRI